MNITRMVIGILMTNGRNGLRDIFFSSKELKKKVNKEGA